MTRDRIVQVLLAAIVAAFSAYTVLPKAPPKCPEVRCVLVVAKTIGGDAGALAPDASIPRAE
jgi:hypothetical protein